MLASLGKLRGRSWAYAPRALLDLIHELLGSWLSRIVFRLAWIGNDIRCGRSPDVYGRVIVRSPRGKIRLGNRVSLISSSWRSSPSGVSHPVRLRTFGPTARIEIGDGSGLSGGSITARSQTIRIGNNTLIGPDCLFVDSDFHVPWPPELRSSYSTAEFDSGITVGDNVWFGARCVVLKGVTIGDNSVIGAGSVVVSSIPANCLAAGNPARVLKTYGPGGAE
jgi:acetyltransferase-like isoleucine patch superfamily enzyme